MSSWWWWVIVIVLVVVGWGSRWWCTAVPASSIATRRWWRWWWSLASWAVIYARTAWGFVFVVAILSVIVVVTTLFTGRWRLWRSGTAWSHLLHRPVRVDRWSWPSVGCALSFHLFGQTSVTLHGGCCPWFLLLHAVFDAYVGIASFIFQVMACVPVICKAVAIRLRSVFLPSLVPLGVGPSGGALLRIMSTSSFLVSGHPRSVVVYLALTAVQSSLDRPGLALNLAAGGGSLLRSGHLIHLLIPRKDRGLGNGPALRLPVGLSWPRYVA